MFGVRSRGLSSATGRSSSTLPSLIDHHHISATWMPGIGHSILSREDHKWRCMAYPARNNERSNNYEN